MAIIWHIPAILSVVGVLGLIVLFELGIQTNSLALIPYSSVVSNKYESYMKDAVVAMKLKLDEIISISQILWINPKSQLKLVGGLQPDNSASNAASNAKAIIPYVTPSSYACIQFDFSGNDDITMVAMVVCAFVVATTAIYLVSFDCILGMIHMTLEPRPASLKRENSCMAVARAAHRLTKPR